VSNGEDSPQDYDDEIDRLKQQITDLETENARLRLELEKIAWMDEFLDEAGTRAMIGIARAALSSHKNAVSDMVERVATIIEGLDKTPSVARSIARQIIKAMREPNTEMKKAGASPDYSCGDDAADIWRLMIDAALSTSVRETTR